MTVAEFMAAMPAFENESAPRVQAALDASAAQVGVAEWGDLYTEALANWVAHRIVMNRPTNAEVMADAGDATLETVGRITIQRDAGIIRSQQDNPLLLTGYGREYLRLVRLQFGGSTVAA